MRLQTVALVTAGGIFSILMALIDGRVMVGQPFRIGLMASASVIAVLGAFRVLRAHDEQFIKRLSWCLVAATSTFLLILVLASLSARE